MQMEQVDPSDPTFKIPLNFNTQTRSELYSALSKAQGAFTNPPKNKTAMIYPKNGKQPYSYKYADLADIITMIRPVLVQHGLSVTQTIDRDPGGATLTTLIAHTSGQSIKSSFPLQLNMSPQEFGSQLTYYRRYTLCSALGIAADEDDDATTVEDAHKATAQSNLREPRRPDDQPAQKPSGGKFIPAAQSSPIIDGVDWTPRPVVITPRAGFLKDAAPIPDDLIHIGQFAGRRMSEIPAHELRSYIIGIDQKLAEVRGAHDQIPKDRQQIYFGAIEELEYRKREGSLK